MSPLLRTKGTKSFTAALMELKNKPPRSCPRCFSKHTKFCYFNNYSVKQPRYFCKTCRRYWTHGGLLRNIPYGGSSRKCKRPRYTPHNNKRQPPPQPQPAAVITTTHGYEVPMLRNDGWVFSPRVESSNFHFLLQGFGHFGPFELPEFPSLASGCWTGGSGGVGGGGGGQAYWASDPWNDFLGGVLDVGHI